MQPWESFWLVDQLPHALHIRLSSLLRQVPRSCTRWTFAFCLLLLLLSLSFLPLLFVFNMSSNPITTFGTHDPYNEIIHSMYCCIIIHLTKCWKTLCYVALNVLLGVVINLFSFDTAKQEKVLKQYYFDDASFASPLLCTSGVDSIRR